MTKRLLYIILLISVCVGNKINASHVAGAEMTYTSEITATSGSVYSIRFDFTLKVYRDCGGVGLGSTANIYYDFGQLFPAIKNNGNPRYDFLFEPNGNSIEMNRTSVTEIDIACSSQPTDCNGGSITGYETHTYTGSTDITVDIFGAGGPFTGATTNQTIRFYFNNYARPAPSNNIVSPGARSLYNQVFFNLQRAAYEFNTHNIKTNNSPTVTQAPVFYACAGDELNFSNIASDIEGDNIEYYLVNPLYSGIGTGSFPNAGSYQPEDIAFVGAPARSFNDPFGPDATGFNLNNQTGQLSFTPTVPGVYSFSIMMVEKTKVDTGLASFNDVKSTIMRDYQFNIQNCPPAAVVPNATGPDFDTTSYIYQACYTEPFCFQVLGLGTGTDTNFLRFNNEIDTAGDPLTYFTIDKMNADSTVATFCWDPDSTIGVQTFTITSELDLCPYKRYGTFTYTIYIDTNYLTVCQDTVVYLDAAGQVTIDSSYVWDTTVSNPCEIADIFIDRDQFFCTDTGDNIVNLTSTFSNGLIRTCQAIVRVLDTIPPDIVCQPANLYIDSNGVLIVDTTGVISSVTDNCGLDSVWVRATDTLFGCVDTGVSTITVYAMDFSGNMDSCVATITIFDSLHPNISCLSPTLYLDGSGQAIIDTSLLIDVVNDNCTLDSVWTNLTTSVYTCPDTGTHLVTVYVSDSYGYMDSCVSTVTVLDTTNPQIVCNNPTFYLDGTGSLIIDTSGLITSVNDNCSLDSVWIDASNTSYGCVDTGVHMVTVYAMDPSGNIDSCISAVTVLDTINPQIVCNNPTFYLDATGTLVIDTTGLITSVNDNCSLDSVWIDASNTTYGCIDTGVHMVTVYAIDPSGNIDSCTSTVTVLDTINPQVICNNPTVYLDATGNIVVDTSLLLTSVNDNCSVDSVWINPLNINYGCLDTGVHIVTVYAMDPSGNIDSCESTVTVLDTTNPQITCNNPTFYLDGTGSLIIDTTGLITSVNDNCSLDSVWIDVSNTTYGCTDTGVHMVTVYVTDPSGNIDSCTSTITILDTITPTVTCLNQTLYLDSNGQLAIDTTGLIGGYSDNCSVDSVWLNPLDTSLSCIDTGLRNVTIYVMDPSGNIDSCISQLTIIDSINPIVICQDTTIYLDTGGFFTIDSSYIDNGSNDACAPVKITLSQYLFSCSDTGVNTITMYVSDANGNIDSCTAQVTVFDTIPPLAICNDTTIYLDSSGQFTIDSSYVDGGSDDPCGVFVLSETTFTCADTGANNVTLYVSDLNGNIDSCTAVVTVVDTILPSLVCLGGTYYLDSSGNVSIDTSGLIFSFYDNCSVDSIWIRSQDTSMQCADTGTNTITIYISDVNGNIDSCSSIITILDTITPVVICQDTTIYLDTNGFFTIDSSFIDNGSYDSCGIQSITLSQYLYSCADSGTNTITMYVTDINGNVDSCTANITVIDTLPPIAICQDTTIYLDALGQFTIDSSYIDGGSNDPCGIFIISQTDFDCSHLGANNVQLTVTDLSGNPDSCIAVVTVLDTINPQVSCNNATYYLDGSGNLTIDTSGLISSVSDNCGVDSVWINSADTNFGCVDTGVQMITIYVTDASGNIDSCMSTITVLDTINPQIICNNPTFYLDATGSLVIDTTGLITSVNDNCSLDSVWIDPSDENYGCVDTGIHMVTVYAMDPSGNVDSCMSTVTVLDTINPQIICNNPTFYLDATGSLVIDTTGLITNVNDNCSLDSVWIDTSDENYGCIDTGVHMVTVYAMDPSGNIDSCTSTVIVLDTINPQIICNNPTFYLDATGSLVIDTTGLITSVNDNCSLDSVWIDPSDENYGCIDTGVHMVTVYAMDVSGNIDSCTSTLTVLDTINPQIVCNNPTFYLDATGSLVIDTTDLITSVNDNCSLDSLWIDPSDENYGCVDTGIHMVTVYAMDPSGNVDSCMSTVTVLDTINPQIICNNPTFYLDATGSLVIDTTGLITSVNDNCSLDSVWIDPSDENYGCIDTGIHMVTVYAMDASGNVDSCTSTLTVLDTINPQIVCNNPTFYLDATGSLVIDTTGLITSVNDNCSLDSVWINASDENYGCIDTGVHMVTVYAMDVSGNIDSCTSTLTVLDTINPQIVCNNPTFYLDATGSLVIDTTGLITSVNDNCSLDSVWINASDENYGCIDTGVHMVTVYAMDVSGNIDSCTSTLTVLDTINPQIVCNNPTFYLDATGSLVIDTTGLITSVNDNCSLDSVWIDPSDENYGCIDTGVHMVTVYAMDPSGNVDSCASTVTIFDTVLPAPVCSDTSIYLDVLGQFTIDSSYINGGSSDACGIATITLSRYFFDCSDTGVNQVTMYVTDVNGNIDSCSAFVTVYDTTSPIAVCMDTTVYLDATGNISIDSSFIDGGSTDPCGIHVLSQSDFNCSNLGPNNVTLYVFDQNGNTDSCNAIVTVLDTIAPIVVCTGITVYLDSTGNVMLDSNAIDNGSSDACGIDSMYLSINTFSCLDTGQNSVTLYVVDESGNIDSCSSFVRVVDTIVPYIYAGPDDSVCAAPIYNFAGNTPTGTYLGQWNLVSGPSGVNFADSSLPSTSVTGLIEGRYLFEWTISNGPNCIVARDTMILDVFDLPVSNAGTDTSLCNQFSLGLNATPPVGTATGVWTYVSPAPTVPSFVDNTNPFTVVSNLDEGTYQFVWTVSNGNCFDDVDTVTVNIYELPTATAGVDIEQCGRQDVVLSGNIPAGTATGMWSIDATAGNPNTPIFSSPNNPTTTISNLIEGTYTILWTVSNGTCADAVDTMRLTIYDSVTAEAGADTNLCGIYTYTLDANVAPGTATGVWTIIPGAPSTPIFSDINDPNATISGLVEGLYELVWTQNNGVCPSMSDIVRINVWDDPTTFAGQDTSLCGIYSINLFATPLTGSSVGEWSLDPSFSQPNNPIISNINSSSTAISGLVEGTYRLLWTVTNGPCYSYQDTVEISVYDQPVAVAGPDQNWCDIFSTTISAAPLTGSATGSWHIISGTPNNPAYTQNVPTTTVAPLQEAGVYEFYYEALNGTCPASRDTLTIYNNPIPQAGFTQDEIEICQDGCIQFTNQSTIHPSAEITGFDWIIGGQFVDEPNPYVCFPTPGIMDVQLIVESNNGCYDTTYRPNAFEVYITPIAGFSTFLIDDENTSTRIQVQDQSNFADNYWYSFGDGDSTTLQNPVHEYYDSGFYDITQIVTNNFGCADTIVETINVQILTVYVPNTFTPDGDLLNEGFAPIITGDDPSAYLFRVFNRWGQLIFESRVKNEQWEGTFKGQKVKTDTYVWTLRTKYQDGDREFFYRGHVNILP